MIEHGSYYIRVHPCRAKLVHDNCSNQSEKRAETEDKTTSENQLPISNSLWLGSKISGNFVEMNNQVMKEFFNIDLQLDNLSQEDFVNNIFLFFTNEGKVVLRGNESQLLKLEEFDQERSDLYTARLIEKQALEAANEAWKNGNYIEVIKYLEQINEANLSAPQKMQYKLAKRKLAN